MAAIVIPKLKDLFEIILKYQHSNIHSNSEFWKKKGAKNESMFKC